MLNRFSIPEISGGNLHNAFRYTFWVIGIITFSSSQVFALLHKYDGANLTER
ncbi:major facilitator family transporter HsrA [Neisseria wadsworthii 9715]|uniref:Major facilitator family transporter HsrA n=1 Tax=Neisseria wadsworthii 9715 TaxID=1030841 RepID=G4CQ16_9NEIS|nr:major facilitator family transporter HsrA [Neisseria wadsworthii 9715]